MLVLGIVLWRTHAWGSYGLSWAEGLCPGGTILLLLSFCRTDRSRRVLGVALLVAAIVPYAIPALRSYRTGVNWMLLGIVIVVTTFMKRPTA